MIIDIENQNQFQDEIQTGKVLVKFYSKTCGPCKMLSFILKDIDKEMDDLKIVTVDFDKFKDLKEEWDVAGFPTMIMLKDNKEASRIKGLKQKRAIIDSINTNI